MQPDEIVASLAELRSRLTRVEREQQRNRSEDLRREQRLVAAEDRAATYKQQLGPVAKFGALCALSILSGVLWVCISIEFQVSSEGYEVRSRNLPTMLVAGYWGSVALTGLSILFNDPKIALKILNHRLPPDEED